MSFVCRTCLQQYAETNFINLNDNSSESFTIRDKLAYCIPEIAVDLVIDPTMCTYCATSLTLAFNFKHQCLKSEARLASYVQSKESNSDSVSLNEVYHSLNDVKPAYPNVRTVVLTLNAEGLPDTKTEEVDVSLDVTIDTVTKECERQDNIDIVEHEIKDFDFKPTAVLSDTFHNKVDEPAISEDCIKREEDDLYKANVNYGKDERKNEPVGSKDVVKYKQKRVHKKSNSFTKPFKSKASKLNNLQKHFTNHHSLKDKDATNAKQKFYIGRHIEEMHFQCNKCKYSTKIRKYLMRHIRRIHIRENSFKCEVCDKNFGEKNYLKVHMKIHSGEKLFKCDVCDNKFIRKGDLQKHMKIHTGEKSFTCEVCRKGFSHKSNLNVHMKIHTGEKSFKCDVCNKNFAYKCNVERHMKVHTKVSKKDGSFEEAEDFKIHIGEKPHKCEIYRVQLW